MFWPVPNVDSALVQVRCAARFDSRLREPTFALVDAAFAQRRKMLRQALKQLLGSAGAVTDLLARAGISPTARGEQLSIDQYVRLAGLWKGHGDEGEDEGGAQAPAAARVTAPALAAAPTDVAAQPAQPKPARSAGSARPACASAPGKVNLRLEVGAAGADGYHPLRTVFQAVDLRERVTVTPHPDPAHVGVSAFLGNAVLARQGTGEALEAVDVEDNLAVRAVRAALAARGVVAGFDVEIEKHIPVAGGMAGGSADAAAALVAATAAWGLDLDQGQLMRLGAGLGADVPFCLLGGTALGLGRGDRLVAAQGAAPRQWVFALAPRGLSTPAVFAQFDEERAGVCGDAEGGAMPPSRQDGDHPQQLPAPWLRAVRAGAASALVPLIRNDLAAPATRLRPELADVLACAREAGAVAAFVSGSGPTIACLAGDAAAAAALQEALAANPHVAAVLRASSPSPGARVEWVGRR